MRRLAHRQLGGGLVMGWLSVACVAGPLGRASRAEPGSAASRSSSPAPAPAPRSWAPESGGRPRPPLTFDPLSERCGAPDEALTAAARGLAERRLEGHMPDDPTALSFFLRRAGSPYVWARQWALYGPRLTEPDVAARLERWSAAAPAQGERRCGVVRVDAPDGQELIVAVSVDAIAWLAPLPTHVLPGAWLTVEATARAVPVTAAHVVVLGPRGRPRPLPTSFFEGRVLARFRADTPGRWLVQVLLETTGGPRPALEALVFAGVEGSDSPDPTPAPGEAAGAAEGDPAHALHAMLDAARASEGLGPLRRDDRLDQVAQQHAEQLLAAARLAHDVGEGDPRTRMQALGLEPYLVGENVARAASATRAHRALWASPSHRANLLDERYRSVGVGVAADPGGGLWVVESFSSDD